MYRPPLCVAGRWLATMWTGSGGAPPLGAAGLGAAAGALAGAGPLGAAAPGAVVLVGVRAGLAQATAAARSTASPTDDPVGAIDVPLSLRPRLADRPATPAASRSPTRPKTWGADPYRGSPPACSCVRKLASTTCSRGTAAASSAASRSAAIVASTAGRLKVYSSQ